MTARCLPLLVVFLAGCGVSGEPAEPEPLPSVLVQFRLVSPEGTPGAEPFAFDEGTVYLDAEVLASDEDLAPPRIAEVATGVQLDVRFNADAGVRLDQALLNRGDRQVAMVVDSRVWRVIDVRPQLGASVIRATMDLGEREHTRLLEVLEAFWP